MKNGCMNHNQNDHQIANFLIHARIRAFVAAVHASPRVTPPSYIMCSMFMHEMLLALNSFAAFSTPIRPAWAACTDRFAVIPIGLPGNGRDNVYSSAFLWQTSHRISDIGGVMDNSVSRHYALENRSQNYHKTING